MRLAVELHGTIVGTLDADTRAFDFSPTEEGMGRFGVNSTALSVAIPLAPRLRRDHGPRRRNWFAELLPEGDQYAYLLAQSGIRRDDVPAFLARYGRDLAGALQIWDLDDPTEPKTPSLRPVTLSQVRSLLEDPIGSPLGNDPAAGKSSLGGVQPKIVLTRTEAGWAQALGGYPTTHILKPQLGGDKATVIHDEEFGSRLARRMGLAAFMTWVEHFDGLAALVIERYDRVGDERLHQEDFSQALGARGNEKYQSIGGVVGLGRIAAVLRRHATNADLNRLARMVVFAAGIGNLDMHTKNLGLLHPIGQPAELAPAYDVVPQAHAANDGELALAVNRKYRLADLTKDDITAEVSSWGVRRAAATIDDALEEISSVAHEELPLDGAFSGLRDDVLGFVGNLVNGRRIGEGVSRHRLP